MFNQESKIFLTNFFLLINFCITPLLLMGFHSGPSIGTAKASESREASLCDYAASPSGLSDSLVENRLKKILRKADHGVTAVSAFRGAGSFARAAFADLDIVDLEAAKTPEPEELSSSFGAMRSPDSRASDQSDAVRAIMFLGRQIDHNNQVAAQNKIKKQAEKDLKYRKKQAEKAVAKREEEREKVIQAKREQYNCCLTALNTFTAVGGLIVGAWAASK